MPKIRLIACCPNYPPPVCGGLENQALKLSRSLVPLLESVVVLSNQHSGTKQPLREEVDGLHVLRSSWKQGTRIGLIWNLMVALWFLLLNRGRYDVIHVHNLSSYATLVSFAAWILRRPCLVKLPNVGDQGIPGLCRGPLGKFRKHLLRRATAFVAMSPVSVAELTAIGIDERRIFKMVNGIDFSQFDRLARGASPDEFDCPLNHHGKVRFIFTGRLITQKGLDDLIGAWKLFAEQTAAEAELLIAGSGAEESRLKALVTELGLDGSVRFLGFRDDVPLLLRSADVFVLPSHSEGNSNSILEAMAAGLPVVATDVGGSALLVGEDGKRYIVEPRSIEKLSEVLLRLAESDSERVETGKKMRERVEKYFSIDGIAASYAAAYKILKEDGGNADLRLLASELVRESGSQ